MRKFYLENSIGERKDLQLSSFFFHTPEGLGISNRNEYENPADGFFSNVFGQTEQINIVGEIAFMGGDPYGDYKSLIDWIYGGYGLEFVYNPNGTEYFCDVDIDYIEKGEINYESGVLRCPVSFLGKTPWYKATATVFNFALDPTIQYKKYPYTYPYVYSLSGQVGSIAVTPSGHYPAVVELTANGEMTNPSLTLVNANGDILGKMRLDSVTIASGSVLSYSSDPSNPGVWIDGIDASQYLNLEYDNFFTIPREPCTISLSFIGPSETATIYVKQYYRSV